VGADNELWRELFAAQRRSLTPWMSSVQLANEAKDIADRREAWKTAFKKAFGKTPSGLLSPALIHVFEPCDAT
jgi:hypothetical protein